MNNLKYKLIVGLQNVDYVKKDTDRRIRGTTVYYNEEPADDRIIGYSSGSIYLPERLTADHPLSVGDEIAILYDIDRLGKPRIVGIIHKED